jgi:hypothetical protein
MVDSLIDQQDSLSLENAALTLKDVARIATDRNGCVVVAADTRRIEIIECEYALRIMLGQDDQLNR